MKVDNFLILNSQEWYFHANDFVDILRLIILVFSNHELKMIELDLSI